jgi:hypothetical protein
METIHARYDVRIPGKPYRDNFDDDMRFGPIRDGDRAIAYQASLESVILNASLRMLRMSTTSESRTMIEKALMQRIWTSTRRKTRAEARTVAVE